MDQQRPVLRLGASSFEGLTDLLKFHGFQVLKPWESHLSLDAFLASHCCAVRALLVSSLVHVDDAILEKLPSLGVIVTMSAGVSHIDLQACRRKGIVVTNAGDAFTGDAADYAVGLLLDVLRRVSASDRLLRGGFRGCPLLACQVAGKRVGIVGLGRIGSATARRLQAFGCIISYTSRTMKPSVPFTFFTNVRDLAAQSDVLVLTCALTEETHHIVNKEVLAALGKNGVVINVGRGSLIDEKELVRSLVHGEIGGAGLDVFENEPKVPEELLHMNNVVLSPHKAVATLESQKGVCDLTVANLIAFFENKPLSSVVEL
ncbi:glyoxylate/hydroxypyruvate reductase HPR3-like isoform X1 [Nymphaea colorata]|nr:glyoxylate/hydroxypyruvate reductase HPR3-like isoform X1 [Nymphaea colorata]XP_031495950.1 glyoxylate/hydroxypyruvate reductase HPR3-like isoform X1 [Nymphaea colorata]XP_049935704.1 glyoxylate/hydroxypyruvate reductase HPR3-like isoform X1 [Nymphaea colorata]